MSAWVVSPAHIDVLVHGLIVHEIITQEEATEVGSELYEECIRSVTARYGDARSDLPGYPTLEEGEYKFRPPEVKITGVHLSGAVGCYEYQSCEHDGWQQSRAFALMGRLGGKMPDYGDIDVDHSLAGKVGLPPDRAPWGFDEEHVHPPAEVEHGS